MIEEKGFFKMEVIADNSGEWCGNGRKFLTAEKAKEYAIDLSRRWTLVREWRVIEMSGEDRKIEIERGLA